MRHVIVLWAMSNLSNLLVGAASPQRDPVLRDGPPPGPPFFRMVTRGVPDGLGLFTAMAKAPTATELVLRPAGVEPFRPNPAVRQSQFYFVPQEFRARGAMMRVWPSVPGNMLNYPDGEPGPSNPRATVLVSHQWAQIQDMAFLLLIWMEQTRSRRGRAAMPFMGLWLTVELWSGPELERMPLDILTPWSCHEASCRIRTRDE
ncbi:hypothetical protein MMC15_000945 [Xylographa vitiligo]|nr:hypothetical protein [Xylographa vitiligo]